MQLVLNTKNGEIIIPECKYLSVNDSQECIRELTIKTFELHKPYLERFITKGFNEEIIIDWEEYEKIIENDDYRTKHASEEYFDVILIALGVLTLEQENAWSFSVEDMNPPWGLTHKFEQWHMGITYFTRKKDIIEYARIRWKGTVWSWTIFQMKDVLKKEAI
jgi:hypothetical protein